MRLLVLTQYFWPENFRVNDLVGELAQLGHEVTVLTGLPNYPEGNVFEEFRQEPAKYANYAGVEVIRVPMSPRGQGKLRLVFNYFSFAASASLIGWWKLRGRAFDAIFVFQTSPITVGIPAAVLRTVKRAPVAFWVLDLWPETLEAVGVVRSPKVLGAVGHLVKFVYKNCDLILAQSRSFIPQIRKYAGVQRCIEYFPSWAETLFDLDSAVPAPEVPPASGAFNVMFAGNIGAAQDFPAILAAAEALKSHAHIRWLIVGDGRMAQWVREEIERRGLQDHVLMLGRYPVERMPSFFRHADALLVSLKDEPIFSMTIPGKLQAYLAAGVPVLAMLNGEGRDVVRNAGAGLTCAAGDHAGLAEAVLALSGMTPEERAAMGRNGRELSKHDFDRQTLIRRLEHWLVGLRAKHLVGAEPRETP